MFLTGRISRSRSTREALDIRWRPGSCACAAASAAYRLGLADPHMYVHMPGGTLEVEIKEDGMVYMVGEVGYVGHIQLGNELSEQLRIK